MKIATTKQIGAFIQKYGIKTSLIAERMKLPKATLDYNLNDGTRENRYYNIELNDYVREMYQELKQLLEENDNQRS